MTVSTDVAGHFSIASRGSSDSLFISFLGYSPFRRLVGDQKIFDIKLSLALENVVDEVVVVGFGEQKKITTIGAQSSVRAADLKQPFPTSAICSREGSPVLLVCNGAVSQGSITPRFTFEVSPRLLGAVRLCWLMG